jgi:hypothetical protein
LQRNGSRPEDGNRTGEEDGGEPGAAYDETQNWTGDHEHEIEACSVSPHRHAVGPIFETGA